MCITLLVLPHLWNRLLCAQQAGAPTWTTPSPSGTSQQARNGHTAVMDGDGKMWVFGGWGPASSGLNRDALLQYCL